MKFHNYMEDVVFEALDKWLDESGEVLPSERAKLDIAALVLNSIKPKYVVTQKGSIYTRLAELELQFRADVVRELTKAVDIVKTNPNP